MMIRNDTSQSTIIYDKLIFSYMLHVFSPGHSLELNIEIRKIFKAWKKVQCLNGNVIRNLQCPLYSGSAFLLPQSYTGSLGLSLDDWSVQLQVRYKRHKNVLDC